MTDDAPMPAGFAAVTGSALPFKLERPVATGETSGLVGVGGDSKPEGDSLKPFCVDDVRVTCPLFQAEYGGSTPTSTLQLRFSRTDPRRAVKLNNKWHSRLPELSNWQGCTAYAAECGNVVYAVALWGQPVARMLNGRGWIELRRMAIADDAPKNTATRMIGWMLRELQKTGLWTKAISYQDTAVHTGTIYKASGWKIGNRSEGGEWSRPSRGREKVQTASEKVRWEYAFRSSGGGGAEPVTETSDDKPKAQNMRTERSQEAE